MPYECMSSQNFNTVFNRGSPALRRNSSGYEIIVIQLFFGQIAFLMGHERF